MRWASEQKGRVRVCLLAARKHPSVWPPAPTGGEGLASGAGSAPRPRGLLAFSLVLPTGGVAGSLAPPGVNRCLARSRVRTSHPYPVSSRGGRVAGLGPTPPAPISPQSLPFPPGSGSVSPGRSCLARGGPNNNARPLPLSPSPAPLRHRPRRQQPDSRYPACSFLRQELTTQWCRPGSWKGLSASWSPDQTGERGRLPPAAGASAERLPVPAGVLPALS